MKATQPKKPKVITVEEVDGHIQIPKTFLTRKGKSCRKNTEMF